MDLTNPAYDVRQAGPWNIVRACQGVALLLGALGLAPGAAYLLDYSASAVPDAAGGLQASVGLTGCFIQICTIVVMTAVIILTRRRSAARLAVAATGALVCSVAIWAIVVVPVTTQWLEIADSVSGHAAAYDDLLPRWRYGHMAAFVSWAAGYALLLLAVITDRPSTSR